MIVKRIGVTFKSAVTLKLVFIYLYETSPSGIRWFLRTKYHFKEDMGPFDSCVSIDRWFSV